MTIRDVDDPGRLAAVRSYDVIDRPPEEDLQAVARLAAKITGASNAAINLIDDVFQHQVATEGSDPSRILREDSWCYTTVQLDEPVYVPDVLLDPRFRDTDNANGTKGSLRFYAASQLRTPEGYVIGALCVYGDEAQQLDAEQRRALDDLAEQVVSALEMRRAQADLQREIGELQRSNADLESFAGRVAHDLRNPLTAIIGFLSLAERRFSDDMSDRLKSIISTSLSSAQRMGEMIDDVLAYAGLGANPVMENVDLAALLRAVETDLEATLSTAGALLTVGALPSVVTDRTLVRVVLQNLISNAVKFGREDVAPHIAVTGGVTEVSWWVSVADNGRGVPDAERGRIFEPFTRASNSTGAPGTGIGLATCSRVVSRLGGTIEVSETPGGGATFRLTMPPGPTV